MALRKLRVEGDPILAKKSKPIKEMTPRLRELIEDMKETMRHENGAGLAGVQVGILKQIFIVDTTCDKPDEEENIMVFINAEIIERSGAYTDLEGCLSVPGQHGIITRSQKVKVRYLDENMQEQEIVAEDFFAKAMQHESDHLQGILYNSKAEVMNPTDDEVVEFFNTHKK